MRLLNAIEIDDSDFVRGNERKHWQMAMTKRANWASLTADFVLYHGHLIKNRFGPITGNVEKLRPRPVPRRKHPSKPKANR